MRNTVNIFIASVLALNFLVSFTGVRLLIHSCFHCEVTEYNILSDPRHNCCEHGHIGHNHNHTNDSSCCTNPDKSHNSGEHCDDCCSTELEYVKNEYNAAQEKSFLKILVPVTDVPSTIESACCAACFESKSLNDYNEKPPRILSGKEFIIYSHQLKIC